MNGTPRRRGWEGITDRPAWAFWILAGPFFAGLVVFGHLPLLWSIYLSFFEARNTVTPTEFVGLANYARMLTSRAFLDSLLTFTLFALFVVPLTFALSLGLALLLHRARRARPLFRTACFLPAACSYVVAALVWRLTIFNGLPSGLANTVIGHFGAAPIAWLAVTDPPWYWPVLVSLRLWLQVGFYALIFLAGLQRIPHSLYEAAYVDGASPGWTTFRHITLPQLRATSIAVLLLNLIAAYQAFDEFYNLLGADGTYPPYARPPLVYLYYTALGSGQDLGRGSAGAVILALLIAAVTLVQGRLLGIGRGPR
ncbi:carbohydrate ABC transporter permease [Marinactinospora thermotolerans]|uniref:Carbohydrate ABC transporter membrane protein 1, CUT1 family (TC 3.A.1.1.-) n=1 Tax=Marinactinospora thermotolerans DSM 45154 TaxID=1122192 RepID=A0A1T4R6L9_9ACTN|nr:sugar ABC transporter permease [Marinactinospora thermotolerans]SKA11585.1 carbohydrate ABC transporter membrane protein 1, CUT1 family (TC 3.A.1.1.-) [Marinactinospora thermotolerans DSM 45154]